MQVRFRMSVVEAVPTPSPHVIKQLLRDICAWEMVEYVYIDVCIYVRVCLYMCTCRYMCEHVHACM